MERFTHYESAALPTELRRLASILNARAGGVKKPEALLDVSAEWVLAFRVKIIRITPALEKQRRSTGLATAPTRLRADNFRSPLRLGQATGPITYKHPRQSPAGYSSD